MQISDHLKGILITTLGVIILSPDAIFIRLLESNTFAITFWRGIALFIGVSLLMLIIYRRKTIQQFKNIGKSGIINASIFALGTLFFTIAIQNTSVSNTLVIISTSPMIAALLSWVFLKERIKLITWIAMFVITGSILAIMSSSIQSGKLIGDLCAFISATTMAISFTMTRHKKEINMVPAMAVSGLVAALIAIPFFVLSDVSYALTPNTTIYLILDGICISLAFALITLGPRYMPAPEVGLIMPLETVLGSYLAWIFLREEPSLLTIIGGFIVIATLSIHAWLSLKDN